MMFRRGNKGMLNLMDKQKIIVSHFLEGKSQWDIHRTTGFDRKTIRKYIRQYEEKRSAIFESNEENGSAILN